MNRLRRRLLQGSGTLLAAACALPRVLHAAPAQWPNKPVRLIVVYPPGGVSDGMARVLAEPLARSLGVPVLIENRPGAGGSLGMDALSRATPDGCTLAFSAISPLTLHPLLARVPYDPMRAFVPVASVMRTPVLVVGTPAISICAPITAKISPIMRVITFMALCPSRRTNVLPYTNST